VPPWTPLDPPLFPSPPDMNPTGSPQVLQYGTPASIIFSQPESKSETIDSRGEHG
jgi:hypothetical protein